MRTSIVVSGRKIDVFSNFEFAHNVVPDRAVVVVHGTNRNAEDYHRWMLAAAKKAGVDKKTLVISPYFKAWSNDAWKEGGTGSNYGPSSFLVMDQLLALAANKVLFPNISRIALAGHSAGAQFTQRYAVFGEAPLGVAYVVCNPSSYVCLDRIRPKVIKDCSRFNEYKYGLDHRSGYVAKLSSDQAIGRFINRRVTIANGSKDVTTAGDLDVTCEAMTQGPNRLARGGWFAAHTRSLWPTAPHDYRVVPGVAHSASGMFYSPILRSNLFGVVE